MQLAAGTQLDRYVVLDRLGEGGMATVWLVRHQRLNSLHALKILHSAKPSLRERLVREGQAQSGLRHSHVVAVTDVIDVDGMPGLVMEYVDGPDLSQLLARHRLSIDEADALARPILDAVAAAHRAGLVHRDLKPANVLLAIEDGRLRPKVTDFGLAKVLEDPSPSGHRTRSGVAMGTPAYMAPEQVRDASRVDERADVFALGCILFEMVTGRTAFTGADSFELLERVVRGEFEDVRSLRPEVPEAMVVAIHGALLADLDARIPSVEAVRDAWSDGRSAPEPAWGELVEVARSLCGDAAAHGSTWSGGANRTWTGSLAEDGPESSPTHPSDAGSLAPTRSAEPARAGWGRTGLVASTLVIVSALAVTAYRALPTPVMDVAPAASEVMTSTEAVRISEDAVVQKQFDEAWRAFLDADFRTAERRLEVVVETDPPAPLPWFLLAQARLSRDDITGGVEAVWTAVDKSKTYDSPLARLLPHLARVAVAEGWEGEHAEAFWAYLEQHPDDYLMPVVPLYSPASADAPGVVVNRLFAMATERDPEPAVAYALHASGLLSRGSWVEALAVAEQGLARNPGSPALLARKGTAELRSGSVEEAMHTLIEVTRTDPGMIEARIDLALAAWASGDTALFEDVDRQLTSELAGAEERGTYAIEMGWALAGGGDPDAGLARMRAQEDTARAQGEWPLVLELARQQGALRLLQGDLDGFEATQARLREAASAPELSPENRQRFTEVILIRDARLALERGDRDKAQAIRDRLAALGEANPRNVAAIDHELAVLDGRPDDLRPEVFDARCGPRIRFALDAKRAGSPDATALLEAAVEDPSCAAIGRDVYLQSLARAALED